jgi:outer membrane lipoprotein SlyB
MKNTLFIIAAMIALTIASCTTETTTSETSVPVGTVTDTTSLPMDSLVVLPADSTVAEPVRDTLQPVQ